MKVRAYVDDRFYGYCPELGRDSYVEYKKEKIFDVPDKDLIGNHKSGYYCTNILYDKAKEQFCIPTILIEYEICEEGLAKDIPYLDKPFESVEEMREYLSREDVIKMFEDGDYDWT